MKLIRMNDDKIGLLVILPSGRHVVDIGGSLGALSSRDPVSSNTLSRALEDGWGWSFIVKHWARLRLPLQNLANIAISSPGHPSLALRPFTDSCQTAAEIDQIVALDITEARQPEECDPTGRLAMERQFGGRAHS